MDDAERWWALKDAKMTADELHEEGTLKFVCFRKYHAHHNPHVGRSGLCSVREGELEAMCATLHQICVHSMPGCGGEERSWKLTQFIKEHSTSVMPVNKGAVHVSQDIPEKPHRTIKTNATPTVQKSIKK